MSNTILIKRSGTANTAPDAGNLALGELAINYNDGNLFYKNASNQVTVIASNKFLSVSGNVQAGGLVSAVGNITGGNILTAGVVSAGSNITGDNFFTAGVVSATGNLIAGNISTSGAGGNISGANVITGTTVSAVGNAVVGNVTTTGVVSAGSNITGGNFLTSGIVSAAGNIVANVGSFFVGNGSQLTGVTATGIGTLANLSVTGNIDTGNLQTAGVVTAGGNIIGANIFTSGLISAGGNIVTANLNASSLSSSGTVTIATGSGDLNLQPAANIALGNRYVTGVAYPQQDQDAASKLYVDNLVTTAISYHQAVLVATTTTLASTTSGTVTYNQPNGAGNGVGATLTTTGTFDLIDTANVQTVGTRILVKDEANAAHNGVYTWSNATVIVRATDEDTYGAGSATAFSINDYFFVQSGNVNKGSAYIVDEPTGTITFGTSNIGFAQFSSSQVYTANTNAGITLTGTVFSTKVDNITTAFDGGGNIVVKANANLTTPNIGAATGTSLSVTGNVSAGNVSTGGNVVGANIYSGGLLSAAGNIQGNTISLANDVLAIGLISAQGNVTGNYFIGNGSQLTGIDTTQIQNGTSNVQIVSSGGNVTVGVGGVANIAKFTTAGLEVIGVISASGDVTAGGNLSAANLLLTGAYISTTGGTTITLANLVSATGGVDTSSVSASGNVTGGNILTAGIVSVQGNVYGNYFIGNGSQLTGVTAASAGFPVSNGTSNINADSGGPITVGVGGTSNIAVFTTTGVEITGLISATGNVQLDGVKIVQGVDGQTNGSFDVHGQTYSLAGPADNSTTAVQTLNIGRKFNTNLATQRGAKNINVGFSGTDISEAATTLTLFSDTVLANSNATAINTTSGALQVVGGVGVGGNIFVGELISAAGNVTAGNIDTSGLVSAGNLSATNLLLTGAYISTTGGTTITLANLVSATGGVDTTSVSASGNVTGGNILTNGLISVQSNITAGNISTGIISTTGDIFTASIVSAQGNVYANYFIGNGSQLTGVTATGVGTLTNLSVTGNIDTGNLYTAGIVSAGGNVFGNYFVGNGSQLTGIDSAAISNGTSNVRVVSADGNVQVAVSGIGNIATFSTSGLEISGIVSATGNVSANYFIGNGSQLTGIDSAAISNGTSNVRVVSADGNVQVAVSGIGNIATFNTSGLEISGIVSASGNIVTSNNVLTGGLSVSGNLLGNLVSTFDITTTGMANVANLLVTSLANITAITNSTSTTSGALLVAGGAGVAGNVYAGGMYVGNNSVLTTVSTVDGGTF